LENKKSKGATSTYYDSEKRPKLFKNSNFGIVFRATNTMKNNLQPKDEKMNYIKKAECTN
jgi:hypothetical protein